MDKKIAQTLADFIDITSRIFQCFGAAHDAELQMGIYFCIITYGVDPHCIHWFMYCNTLHYFASYYILLFYCAILV